MTVKSGAFVVIAVVVVLAINLAVLTYTSIGPTFMKPTPKPNCHVLHTGTTTVEVTYPPDVVVDLTDDEVVRLYKKDDPGLRDGTAMYVLGLADRATSGYQTVDQLIQGSTVERPGPLYDKKTTFNGLPAALATPSPGYYYYEIPFGNAVIELEYYPRNLSPDARKLTDEMVKGIAFKTVSENVKHARIENCY